MGRLHRYAIRYPRRVIAIGLLLTFVAMPGIFRLTIRTDGHALAPQESPALELDEQIRETFGVEDPFVLLVESNDAMRGIYNQRTLNLVQRLTAGLAAIPGINPETLISLDTEYGFRFRPGTLNVRRLLDEVPRTSAELSQLQSDVARIQIYTGTVVSRDGPPPSCTAIMVGAPPGADRLALFAQIQHVIADQGEVPETIHVIGAPVAEALLGTHILEDLGVPRTVLGVSLESGDRLSGASLPWSLYDFRRLIGSTIGLLPLALLIMAALFLVCFRSVVAAALPLFEIGACLIFVFGLMGYFGVPVYLTIAVLPLVLLATGVADEIHLFTRYVHGLEEQPGLPHRDVLLAVFDEMESPVRKAALTTAIGCASFALSPLAPVRAFGIFTAIGVLFCMFWSLAMVPAALALLSPKQFTRARRAEHDRPQAYTECEPSPGHANRGGMNQVSFRGSNFQRRAGGIRCRRTMFEHLGAAAIRFRWIIVGAFVLLVLLAPFGIRRVLVQDSWIHGFAVPSDFYQATKKFNELFLGTHLLLVQVEAENYLLEGRLRGSDLQTFEVSLPGTLVEDEQRLVGDVITLTREAGAAARTDQGRHFPTEWSSRIESVRREGDTILATTPRTDGSAKFAFRTTPEDTLRYRIEPRPLTDPAILRHVKGLETFIAAHPDQAVADAHGPARYVEMTSFLVRGQQEESRAIPSAGREAQWLWEQNGRIRGTAKLRQLVDPAYAKGLITVFLNDANFRDTDVLMKDIRRYEREHLHAHGITLAFGGDVAVSQTLIDGIVTTQVRSLLGSLLGILVLTAILGRSLLWGVLCTIPCSIAVLLNFAVMGWTGTPLGVATSMFTGMTLGMGVDYAIHVVEHYRRRRRLGFGQDESLIETITVTGRPILINALAVGAGFGVLMLSQVPANAWLGGLVLVSLLSCVAATLLLLPALMRFVRSS